jgi:hypothetical protein
VEALHPLLAAASGSGDNGTSATQVFVLAGTIGVAVLGFAKAIVDFRQARRGTSLPEDRTDSLPVVSVTTSAASWGGNDWSFREWRVVFFVYCVGGLVAAFGGLYAFGQSDQHSIGGFAASLFFIEAVVVAVMGGWMFWQLRGKTKGDAIDRCAAKLVIDGTRQSVVSACRRALVALEAVTAEGMTLETADDGTTTIAGGRGRWPKNNRGQKVTAVVRPSPNGKIEVEVESVTLWPSPLQARRNRENVKRFLELLLV